MAFLSGHLGYPFPSPALFNKIGQRLRQPRWRSRSQARCPLLGASSRDHRRRHGRHKHHRENLKPLLTLEPDEDPDDELLAGGVEHLYPGTLNAAELVAVLREPRARNFIGAYQKLLQDLGDRVSASDLPDVLRWASTHLDTPRAPVYANWMAGTLVERAWHHRQNPEIFHQLAHLLAQPAWRYGASIHQGDQAVAWAHPGETTDRRRLAVAVAETVDERRWFQLLRCGLLREADADWLVDEMPRQPRSAHEVLAICLISVLARQGSIAPDVLQRITSDHPAHARLIALLHTRAQEAENPQLEDPADRQDREQADRLRVALSTVEKDLSQWWHVAEAITNEGDPAAGLFNYDLAQLQGWSQLPPDMVGRILELGLDYVRLHHPDHAPWAYVKSITTAMALPDCAGVYLLTTVARVEPDRLSEIPAPVWAIWAPSVATAWGFENTELLRDLVDAAPAVFRTQIAVALLDDLDKRHDNGESEPRRSILHRHLATELMPQIAQRLNENRWRGAFAAAILDLLVAEHAPDKAQDVCKKLANHPDPLLAGPATAHLRRLDPESMIDNLLARPVTKAELEQAARDLNLERVPNRQLGPLARLLFDAFPMADDPPHDRAADANRAIHQVRNATVPAMAFRNMIDEMEALSDGCGTAERDLIGHYLRQTRQQTANNARTTLTPLILFDLLRRADIRLSVDDASLREAVVAHLEEIQHQISTRAWRDLWDGDKPKLEDDISDWIQRQLQQQLRASTTIDREIQVVRIGKGVGTRIDLTISAPANTEEATSLRVIVEAKRHNNPEVMDALQQQLIERYLNPLHRRDGIYLVYWIRPDQRPQGWSKTAYPDREGLLAALKDQAKTAYPAHRIDPIVLDISKPEDK